jgi:hypothetical protein
LLACDCRLAEAGLLIAFLRQKKLKISATFIEYRLTPDVSVGLMEIANQVLKMSLVFSVQSPGMP